VTFLPARRPSWFPPSLRHAYYPALKIQQALAERRLFRQMSGIVSREGIQTLLTIPVTPWILAASLKLRWAFPDLNLVVFVMDDWQGHHESQRLPFTRYRRSLLRSVVDLAARRFAISREMAELYRQEFGCEWEVTHNPCSPSTRIKAQKSDHKPKRVFLGGDVNIFRFDAVRSLAEGLERYNQRHKATLSLTIFGDVAPDCHGSLANLGAVNLAGRQDQATCLRMMEQADLLYLPLAFDKRVRRIAWYSMPTKLAEYFSIVKPVLFHAPRESAIFRLAERHGLEPRLGTMDPSTIDEFVETWAGGGLSLEDWPAKAAIAAKSEFDFHELAGRFQSALVANQRRV